MRIHQLPTVVLGSLIWIVGLPANWSVIAFAKSETAEQHIETVFSELRTLKPMLAREDYTVRVAGEEETGAKERFLRRRTAQEISNSGLSSGCGDHAILFIERIEPRGFETLLVDAAEISSASLRYHFSGHAVVAIRSKESPTNTPWRLIDSTSLRILSRNWLPAEKSFQVSGRVYWIGYCGPLSDYPVKNGQELREFYAKTLASVPPSILNRTLYRFKYNVDPSLIDNDGKYLNPRLENFIREQSAIFASYDIKPEREVSITLTRGGNGYKSELTYSDENGWVSHIGLKSGCSPSMLSGLEQNIRRHYEHKSKSDTTPD